MDARVGFDGGSTDLTRWRMKARELDFQGDFRTVVSIFQSRRGWYCWIYIGINSFRVSKMGCVS